MYYANEDCTCVLCPVCNGTGYLPTMSKPSDTMADDYSDPIPCTACTGGITEECEACRAREMEAFIDQPDVEYQAA